MYDLKCKQCGKSFSHSTKKTKFCSRECFYESRNGSKRSKETRDKMSKSAKKYYESESGRDDYLKRSKKISDALKKPLTGEEKERVNNVLKFKYVKDRKLILKHSGLPFSYKKRLDNYIETIKDSDLWKNSWSFVPLKIQRFSIDEYNSFIEDSNILDHREMVEKYNFSEQGYWYLCKRIPELKWGKITDNFRSETKIEKIVRNILESNFENVKREQYVNNDRWRVDFLVNDLFVIEVNGDFWHANPKVFDYNNLHKIQKENIIRDVERKEWLINNGYKFLTIWESDIKNNIQLVEKEILKFIK